ncbi:hypothetical protein KRR38_31500 [Novosphingobium sp. G106]|uniref:DUF7665 family protein n=1 Tax=Novosphingobium sp. G106 TaxID=2849500 RepID=UPI001C2CF1AD|nr:hypothetical protein [Novosphingobium sp. G106]MBV1692075.1 hypothetical protein [Novosphingobium sp. G106]
MEDPASALIRADLVSDVFQAGCREGRWRVVEFDYPRLDFKVSAIKTDGEATEYGFRADLTNYPGVAPEVRLWNLEDNRKPTAQERPTGGTRVTETFKDWQDATIYRPWDRHTGPHSNNAANKPQLAWNKQRELAFIFEDLHGILVSNGRKVAPQAPA